MSHKFTLRESLLLLLCAIVGLGIFYYEIIYKGIERTIQQYSVDELETEFMEMLNDECSACFIKYMNNISVGFAQCSLRTDYVEGTGSSPVGYLEGVFVKEVFRKNGYAKELLCACERWAKDRGCREFASDCELDNIASFKFHMAVGFDEANRIICFKKKL